MMTVETVDQPRIRLILRPFQEFARRSTAGGILLLASAIIALLWANSPWGHLYDQLWHTEIAIVLGNFHLEEDLLHWINDGLMAIFFLFVGLEIKREVLIGELASVRRAALPIVAAAGGMLVPAGLYIVYIAVNGGGEGARGWGIPMATDIAFALGIMALLGRRVPLALKVFLVALAIVDDIGAVLVIAVFYTSELSWLHLAAGAVFLLLLLGANRAGFRHPLPYIVLGPRLVGGLPGVRRPRYRRRCAPRTDHPLLDPHEYAGLSHAMPRLSRQLRAGRCVGGEETHGGRASGSRVCPRIGLRVCRITHAAPGARLVPMGYLLHHAGLRLGERRRGLER